MASLTEVRRSFRQNFFRLLFSMAVAVGVTTSSFAAAEEGSESLPYIVRLRQEEPERGMAPYNIDERKRWYASFIAKSAGGDVAAADSRLFYVYEHVMTGFAARLTQAEAEAMRNLDGCVDVVPDKLLPLHTTYSYEFVGLDPSHALWPNTDFGKGVIVGMVDTGIWPESASFNDAGIPPPPSWWKGFCQAAPDFNSSNCNNKLIGARVFSKVATGSWADVHTPRDVMGHGTHTASTAAGNFAHNADIFGYANGTARGMAPYAHIAVYKACFGTESQSGGCFMADALAAMEQAISDGVDVISLSLGDSSSLYGDLIAMGAYCALQRGIFVSCSAGNGGPSLSSLINIAPWIMTVGAATMDRGLVVNTKLGDGTLLYGESLNPDSGGMTDELPLVFAWPDPSCMYYNGSLDSKHATGKIVICPRNAREGPEDRIKKGLTVREAGAAGMILLNDADSAEDVVADAHLLPTSHLGFNAANAIRAYMNSTKTPTAAIESEGTIFGAKRAPAVALFSSRGPSLVSVGVLKPDVIAPGVAVLAAWPSDLSPSPLPQDHRRVKFNTMSGTSMSCPHVSGIAALLKSAHPDWSPAAIKSALMTTADITDKKGQPILDAETNHPADILAMGAGFVNALKATDPGLIYDLAPQDYIPYLCGLNYTSTQIEEIVNTTVTCPPSADESRIQGNLNYPSFIVNVTAVPFLATFKRTVTNVGPSNSTYSVNIVQPNGVEVTVRPESLSFSGELDKKSYSVTIAVNGRPANAVSSSQGFITWVSTSSVHQVRSPVSILWN